MADNMKPKLNIVGERFSSKGFILSAIGSSVGLGNMWKFPYITGENGGAAFFILFMICLLVVGLPILLAELAIGRAGRGNVYSALAELGKSKVWGRLGLISILAPFIIYTFYGVIAGWTLYYAIQSFTGQLFQTTDFQSTFLTFSAGYMPLFFQFIMLAVTGWVLVKGVSKGIEKFNKFLIPMLLVILLIMMVRAISLPNAGEGISFFLNPDFSKLTAESALIALGHAFFSLSLGMGIMITYGTYVNHQQSLGKATWAIGGGDLLYAFIAGMIIFPIISSAGLEPSQGVGLAFIALPGAFATMPLGQLFGGLFFVILAIAALTSMVSILEVPVAFATHKWKWSRKQAVTRISATAFVIGIFASLSISGPLSSYTIGGKGFFDLLDFIASNILLPIGSIVVTLFVGYVWKRAGEEAGLNGFWFKIWILLLRYIVPVLVIAIMIYSVIGAL